MRPTILLLPSALALAVPSLAAGQAAPARWDELHRDLLAAPVATCLECHGEAGARHAHPVGVPYASTRGTSLRPREEVERRGVALPEGNVHCWSCHSASSPWRFHLFIPAGATPRTRVIPGVERTYATGGTLPPPGSDVSPKPLCMACHTIGD